MRTSTDRPRVRRNPSDALVAGVCSGLASYLDTDKTLVRIGAIVCGLVATKLTLLCYGAAWLLLDD